MQLPALVREKSPSASLPRPPPLSALSLIQIFAPSAHFRQEDLLKGQKFISLSSGLTTYHHNVVFQQSTYFAGPHDERSKDFIDAVLKGHGSSSERANDAIWAARGGYGAAKVVEIAFDSLSGTQIIERLRSSPMWLVGFSDLTALNLAMWSRACLCLHGPMVTGIVDWSEAAQKETFEILMGDKAMTQVFKGKLRCFGGGEGEFSDRCLAKGKLLGGNLMVLESMITGVGNYSGIDFIPSLEGCILLLEDVGEEAYKLHRLLTSVLRAPQLKGISAIAIGQLTNSTPDKDNYEAYDMLMELLTPLGIPVLTDLDIGHENATARPVVLGAESEIWSGGELRVLIPGC